MTAVAERKAPARQQPSRAMLATAVGQLEHPAQAAGMFGRHILLTHHALFGHVIEAGDVISVDFDARRITSAANKPLTPAEIAEGYKRLKAFGWTPAQIAKKVGRSAQHVQDLLALGNAPSPVREMVKAGQVSATRAAKAARKHGDKATAVLGEQLQQAQAQGKKRITAATTDKPKPSASELQQERARLDWVIEHRGIVFHLGGEYCVTFPFEPDAGTTPYRDSPREAIDTAMSLQKGSGQ